MRNNRISTKQFANLVARNLFIQYHFEKVKKVEGLG